MRTKNDFQWYHEIDLGELHGKTHPQADYRDQWEQNRKTRDCVSYADKHILDVASWNGMWAFEAEARGAARVFATDIVDLGQPNTTLGSALDAMLFARQCRGSSVIPYYNVSVHHLTDLLPLTGHVDIVQCLGMLYHVENPWQALKQCRRMLKPDGQLLLETATIDNGSDIPIMRLNRGKGMFYGKDETSYWALNLACLFDLLQACLFEPRIETMHQLISGTVNGGKIGRTVLWCAAREAATEVERREFHSDYRSL